MRFEAVWRMNASRDHAAFSLQDDLTVCVLLKSKTLRKLVVSFDHDN